MIREVTDMAKCDVWMPLYIGDYLSNTSRLTTEQHGAYLLLIMDYWVNGRLPDDDAALANVTKLTLDRWLSIRPAVIKYFTVQGGELVQERIETEKEKAEYLSKVRADAGSKGGSKTQAKYKANVKHGLTPLQSPSHSQLQPPPQSEKNKDVFVLPDWIPEDLWTEWMGIRKRKKAINSKRALDALVTNLDTIRNAGISPEKAISTAIEKSWKGIELEWLTNGNGNGQKPGKIARAIQALS